MTDFEKHEQAPRFIGPPGRPAEQPESQRQRPGGAATTLGVGLRRNPPTADPAPAEAEARAKPERPPRITRTEQPMNRKAASCDAHLRQGAPAAPAVRRA